MSYVFTTLYTTSWSTYDVLYDVVYDVIFCISVLFCIRASESSWMYDCCVSFRQALFKLLYLLDVIGMTRRWDRTVMMKEITKTTSTVHQARWHTVQDLIILLPVLWHTCRTSMTSTCVLRTTLCEDCPFLIPAHLHQGFCFRTR